MRGELRHALLAACSAADARTVCEALLGAVIHPTSVLGRFWLRDADGDLQLQASAGFRTGGGAYGRIDGEFSRIAYGHGKIGQIAATRQPLIVRGLRGDEEWLANPGWIARQGARAFVGLPLIGPDDVLGVIATFDRAIPGDDALEELRFIADVAATRLVALRRRAAEPAGAIVRAVPGAPAAAVAGLLTRTELRAREKANLEAALAATRGNVFGQDGAAALLGMRPTTLASRIKALRIAR